MDWGKTSKTVCLENRKKSCKGCCFYQITVPGSVALTCKLVLVDLWVNKFPPCSAFGMKTCWHCQVSTVSTSLLPLFTFLSIHYLTRQIQPQFTKSWSVFTAAAPQLSTLTRRCGCHIAVNEEHQVQTIQGQSHSFLFLCPMSHVLAPSIQMLNGTSHPPAYCWTFFSHYSRLQHVLSGFRLLTNSFSATPRAWLRLAGSGKNTHFDEYLEGILQTL